MYSKITLLSLFFISLLCQSCQLPTNDVVEFEKYNKIEGFSSPFQSVLDTTSDTLYVLDKIKGLIVLNFNDTRYSNLEEIMAFPKNFSVDTTEIIKTNTLPENTPVPYDVKSNLSSSALKYELIPISFAVISKNATPYAFVISTVSISSETSDKAGNYFGGMYYILKINLHNKTVEWAFPLDAVPKDEADKSYDVGHKGRGITVSNDAIFIAGDKYPIRIIPIDADGNIHPDYQYDENYNRKVLTINSGSKKTTDPNLIQVYEDKIYLSSRNNYDSGIHCYAFSLPLALGSFSTGLPYYSENSSYSYTRNFPKSMRIVGGNLYASFYKNFIIYQLNPNNPIERSIFLNDNVMVIDSQPYNNLYIASYNYKIEENKIAETGYDHFFIRSGIAVFDQNFTKIKDFYVDGNIRNTQIIEKNSKILAISICQDKTYLIVNGIE